MEKSPKWKCPECGRTFAVRTPEHSCVVVSAESHFEGKPASLKKAYDKLVKSISALGEVSVQPIKNYICFKKAATFASVTVRKDHFKVEFFLGRTENVFPIEKTFFYSKNKVVHVVPVSGPEDIDKQLLAWIAESYFLAK